MSVYVDGYLCVDVGISHICWAFINAMYYKQIILEVDGIVSIL